MQSQAKVPLRCCPKGFDPNREGEYSLGTNIPLLMAQELMFTQMEKSLWIIKRGRILGFLWIMWCIGYNITHRFFSWKIWLIYRRERPLKSHHFRRSDTWFSSCFKCDVIFQKLKQSSCFGAKLTCIKKEENRHFFLGKWHEKRRELSSSLSKIPKILIVLSFPNFWH